MTSIIWSVPGTGPVLSGWRVSLVTHHQSGSPYSIIYSGDPTGAGAGLNAACNSRGCQNPRPGARNTERGMFINACLLARLFRWRRSLELRADVFNVLNNQNLLAGGYFNQVGHQRFGEHSGGSNVLPGRQFSFAGTFRF